MKDRYLYFNSRDELYRVDINRIVYFEADGNYVNFVACGGQKGTVWTSLTQMEHLLTARIKEDASSFARIGRKYIINLNYVFHINIPRQQIVLSDGNSFTFQTCLSKESLKQLKDFFVVSKDK